MKMKVVIPTVPTNSKETINLQKEIQAITNEVKDSLFRQGFQDGRVNLGSRRSLPIGIGRSGFLILGGICNKNRVTLVRNHYCGAACKISESGFVANFQDFTTIIAQNIQFQLLLKGGMFCAVPRSIIDSHQTSNLRRRSMQSG